MATAGLSKPCACEEVAVLTEHLVCPGPVPRTQMLEARPLSGRIPGAGRTPALLEARPGPGVLTWAASIPIG